MHTLVTQVQHSSTSISLLVGSAQDGSHLLGSGGESSHNSGSACTDRPAPARPGPSGWADLLHPPPQPAHPQLTAGTAATVGPTAGSRYLGEAATEAGGMQQPLPPGAPLLSVGQACFLQVSLKSDLPAGLPILGATLTLGVLQPCRMPTPDSDACTVDDSGVSIKHPNLPLSAQLSQPGAQTLQGIHPSGDPLQAVTSTDVLVEQTAKALPLLPPLPPAAARTQSASAARQQGGTAAEQAVAQAAMAADPHSGGAGLGVTSAQVGSATSAQRHLGRHPSAPAATTTGSAQHQGAARSSGIAAQHAWQQPTKQLVTSPLSGWANGPDSDTSTLLVVSWLS